MAAPIRLPAAVWVLRYWFAGKSEQHGLLKAENQLIKSEYRSTKYEINQKFKYQMFKTIKIQEFGIPTPKFLKSFPCFEFCVSVI